MPTRAKLTLKGFDRYLEAIKEAGRDVDAAAARAVQAGGEVALNGMQERVPKDTHNLEEHLELQTGRDGNVHYAEIGLLKDTDADTARYGNVQEFGSTTTAAQPYVRPTMDEDKNKIRKAMRESLEKDGLL
jgi:HK97 gp10 family phage protein